MALVVVVTDPVALMADPVALVALVVVVTDHLQKLYLVPIVALVADPLQNWIYCILAISHNMS